MLALSSCPGSDEYEDDARTVSSVPTISGKFFSRAAWHGELIEGWRSFYHQLLGRQGMVDRDSSWAQRRRTLHGMVDHILRRALETEPLTYPTLWLHPRDTLYELGRALAENMPSSFNAKLAKIARDPHALVQQAPLQGVIDQGKAHLRALFTDDHLLDPACLMLLPSEFIHFLTHTPPASEAPRGFPVPLYASPARSFQLNSSLNVSPGGSVLLSMHCTVIRLTTAHPLNLVVVMETYTPKFLLTASSSLSLSKRRRFIFSTYVCFGDCLLSA